MAPGEDEASIRTVDVLLALGFGIDDPAFTEGVWRATPLWHVISRGRNLKLAEHLLKLGADPDHCLFAAVWNEDCEAIRLLLKFGADIEEGADRGDTPLLGAVAWSKFGPAEELLKAGADPNFRNAKGATALHMMLKKGSAPEHFQLFARHGARSDFADAEGRTADELLRRKRDPGYRRAAEMMCLPAAERSS
jgi:ankyrin repeat protein